MDNILINKNMINIIIQNQDNVSQKDKNKLVIENLNKENQKVYMQMNQLRRDLDVVNSDVLLKNQIIEQNQINSL
tara:strand:- start:249 stop:473 length:225 start_codon:yes stop_codon:yes gene_type:complete